MKLAYESVTSEDSSAPLMHNKRSDLGSSSRSGEEPVLLPLTQWNIGRTRESGGNRVLT